MKFLKFLLFLIPWFLSGILFGNNYEFYTQLNLPFFALPKSLFFIVWTILYLLITISITKINNNYGFKEKRYYKVLLINYIFNQLFLFCFFSLENLFLSFVDTIIIFITSIILHDETKILDDKSSDFLKPYVFFNIYAVILSLTIYFINL